MKTKIKTVILAVLLLALMIPSGVFAYVSGNRLEKPLSVFGNLQPVSGTPETMTPSGFPPSVSETSRQGFGRNLTKSHPESTTLEPGYLLGFELRFLKSCIRSGIIYTDPFGLIWVFNRWLSWAFTDVDYRGGTVISGSIPYFYNPVTGVWSYKTVTLGRSNYEVYRFDSWNYEMIWAPDPFCPSSTPAGATKNDVAFRYLSIEGPFLFTPRAYYSKPKSTNPADQAIGVPGYREFSFPAPRY